MQYYQQQQQQPYAQQQPPQQAQRYHHQQQQQVKAHEIPIIEAEVHIKPSGLPVGSKPAAAAATTPQQQQQQQQQLPLQQLLEQLWSAKVPAAAQGPTVAAVVGSWYHQDAGFLSEVTFMSDGRCYWSRNRSSAAAAAAAAVDCASTLVAASTVSSSGSSGGSNQGEHQISEIWHGIWTMEEGTVNAGRVKLVYIVEQKQQQQGQAGSQQQRRQQQQLRGVSYQRSALDDTLVLDGLAHIKLGAA
jgi:hypothetical protein